MRLSLCTPLLCTFLTQLAFGQATPVITNVTNAAIPVLDNPPASIHLAPRSLATVFGSNLADSRGSTTPSTSLAGTELHLSSDTCFDSSCDLVALLTFASPAQINFIVPDDGSATCTTCKPTGYRIILIRSGQRFDNRAYGSGGPGRVFIDASDTGDNNLVFSIGNDCWFSYSLSDPSSCGLSFSPGPHRAPLGAMTDATSSKLISSDNPVHQGQLITLWMTGLYGGVTLDSGTGVMAQVHPTSVGFGIAQFGQDMANTIAAGVHGPVGALMTPTPLFAGEQPQAVGLDQVNVAFPTCTNAPTANVENRYDAFLTYTNVENSTTTRVYFPFVVRPGDPDCHWLIASTTTVSSNIAPSASGQTVAFTATVFPAGATGTVTFFDGSDRLGTQGLAPGTPVSGGTSSSIAVFSTAALSSGVHSIAAVYGGSGIYQGSSAVQVQIVKASTATTITSNANPSSFGRLTFTATVSPSDATGTITFFDGLKVLANVGVNTGRATLDGGSLIVGAHAILAAYSGDANHQESSGNITQIVALGTPSIVLTSSANPATIGDAVDLTATLCCNVTGTVTFFDGSAQQGIASVVVPGIPISGGLTSSGRATLTISNLVRGTHQIAAQFNGDSNNSPATSGSLALVVNPLNSSITLSSNINPSVYSQSVILTAVVFSKAPMGTVTFSDGGSALGVGLLGPAIPVSGGTSSATATFTVALAIGMHSLTASYSGDTINGPAISAVLTQVINGPQNASITLTSNINPSTFGQMVTFLATLYPSDVTGAVTFFDGSTSLGNKIPGPPVPLSGGGFAPSITFTTSALSVGTHPITARYSGDSQHGATSATVTQTVR